MFLNSHVSPLIRLRRTPRWEGRGRGGGGGGGGEEGEERGSGRGKEQGCKGREKREGEREIFNLFIFIPKLSALGDDL